MAKSDTDSNGLRQDQPECPRHKAGGLGGTHLEEMCVSLSCWDRSATPYRVSPNHQG